MSQIEKKVNELFKKAPRTKQVQEKKEQLIESLEAKYKDLMEVGKTPEEAYDIVIGSIGNIDELVGRQGTRKGKTIDKTNHSLPQVQAIQEKKVREAKEVSGFAQFCAAILLIGGLIGGILWIVVANADLNQTPVSWKNQIKSQIKGTFKGDSLEGDLAVAKQENTKASGIQIIKLELGSADVKLGYDETEEVAVKESTNDTAQNNLFEMTTKDNTLMIKREEDANVFGKKAKHKVEVILPLSFKGQLSVATSSGEIQFISDVEVETLEVATASGEIHMDSLVTAKKIESVSASGAQYIEGLKADEYELTTASGSIKGKSLEGIGKITTASGDFVVEEFKGPGEIETMSGQIALGLTGLEEELQIESLSGDVEVSLAKDMGTELKLKTLSGTIEGSFDKMNVKKQKDHQVEATLGNEKDSEIQIETASGDIKVKVK